MAAPAKQSWGSFLQQAVAGVEARLDNILTEGDEPGRAPVAQQQTLSGAPSPRPTSDPSLSRSSSSTRGGDRLQARLARAVASKTSGTGGLSDDIDDHDVSVATTTGHFATATPIRVPTPSPRSAPTGDANEGIIYEGIISNGSASEELGEADPPRPPPSFPDSTLRDSPVDDAACAANTPAQPSARSNGRYEVATQSIDSPSGDVSGTAVEHQEEIRGLVERIDTLQAKLQYLSREASEAARAAIVASPQNSVARKLAERDQKIALLLEEGQKLAATEQKHRAVIKKLRAQNQGVERVVEEATAARDSARSEIDSLRGLSTRVDELEHQLEESQDSCHKWEEESKMLRRQLETRENAITTLRRELNAFNTGSAADEVGTAAGSLSYRARCEELEERASALEIEKKIATDRAQCRVDELMKDLRAAAEKTSRLEHERDSEVKNLENRLEVMRTQTEEASSMANGDSHVKLIRQIETLQSQYASARNNWEGIEASLIARVANLEKERDDAFRRESDMRKKARSAASRYKEEIEALHDKLLERQGDIDEGRRELETYRIELGTARKRAEAAESSTPSPIQSRPVADRLALLQKLESREKQEGSRQQWLDEVQPPPGSLSRPVSPRPPLIPRASTPDLATIHRGESQIRKGSTSSLRNAGPEFPRGARPHVLAIRDSPAAEEEHISANMVSPPFESHLYGIMTPSPMADDGDGTQGSAKIVASLTNHQNDLASVSTTGAGPSVQLVERMSAAIRRLEGEKVASREDLARVSGQRDEARSEIASLMREVESRDVAVRRVAELESQVADINGRYQTTLEMLGEKSELVEELRADVEDVKAMYRELVERTVR